MKFRNKNEGANCDTLEIRRGVRTTSIYSIDVLPAAGTSVNGLHLERGGMSDKDIRHASTPTPTVYVIGGQLNLGYYRRSTERHYSKRHYV